MAFNVQRRMLAVADVQCVSVCVNVFHWEPPNVRLHRRWESSLNIEVARCAHLGFTAVFGGVRCAQLITAAFQALRRFHTREYSFSEGKELTQQRKSKNRINGFPQWVWTIGLVLFLTIVSAIALGVVLGMGKEVEGSGRWCSTPRGLPSLCLRVRRRRLEVSKGLRRRRGIAW
jgi:hypothetical protein